MSTSLLRLLAVCVGATSCIGVVVGVVMTGRDGRITDLLAIVAVAALLIAWRLQSRLQHATVAN